MASGSEVVLTRLQLLGEFRNSIRAIKDTGERDPAKIAKQTASQKKRLIMKNFDVFVPWAIEVLAMSDKRARAFGEDDIETGLFTLQETFSINMGKQGTLLFERAELTIEAGDRLTEQKARNIKAAVRAKKYWDWEWHQVIRPILVENPGWVYRDAYAKLLKDRGGLPTPPDFDNE